jgi:hypothetical protein
VLSTIGELVLCALAVWPLCRLRQAVMGTTLTHAWWWGCGTVGVAGLACLVRWQAENDGLTFAAGDYLAAVMGLTPFVAVLGARRPTSRVWTPFVMLPLVVVLCWPVVTLVLARGWWGELELETPAVVAFGLVAVMGCGNYFGTRLTTPALAWGALLTGLVVCHCTSAPTWWPAAGWLRLAAGLVGVVGLWRAATVWTTGGALVDRMDQIWFDLLDRFGVVWARRLQERLNLLGQQQAWPGRLEFDGWHWRQPPSGDEQAALEHAWRWLLRRFVDAAWIDARLGTSSAAPSPLKIDS